MNFTETIVMGGEPFAQALYNPVRIQEGQTMKEYAPPDVLAFLHEHWWKYEPLNPLFYYGFALWYIVTGCISVFGNILVLYIFMKHAPLRTPSNILVMNLALSDLCIMGTLFPECVINFFCGGVWQFGEYACIIHAFCGALFGYGQITTLIFISWDRYNVIVRGFAAKPLTFMKVMIFVVIIWLYATFWSIGPLVGFGGYALDGIMASCSFDYLNLEPANITYIWTCFAFCYVLPLFLIMCCYYFIVKAVWAHEAALKDQAKKMNVASLRSNEDAAKQSAEIRIAKVAMINVTLWVIAWTPFAVICLIGIAGDQNLLTPLVSTLPILFSKTSCVYNPLIYAISHPKFRQCAKKDLPWLCINEQVKDNQSTASDVTKVET